MISKKILKLARKANATYKLIEEGDKILVGLSGGKDSFTLTHVLKHLQKVSPYKFEFKAVTINYGMPKESYSFIKDHCDKFDIPYEEIHTNIFELSQEKIRKNSSFCSFFSRMRRGSLYAEALKQDFNKVALGHHLDDAVESFFMNFTYNGALRSLAPKYQADNGLIVIRPLILTRERQLADTAISNSFPVIGDEMCPAFKFDVKMPHARADTKQLLHKLEQDNKDLFTSLKTALGNIHSDSFFQ